MAESGWDLPRVRAERSIKSKDSREEQNSKEGIPYGGSCPIGILPGRGQ